MVSAYGSEITSPNALMNFIIPLLAKSYCCRKSQVGAPLFFFKASISFIKNSHTETHQKDITTNAQGQIKSRIQNETDKNGSINFSLVNSTLPPLRREGANTLQNLSSRNI